MRKSVHWVSLICGLLLCAGELTAQTIRVVGSEYVGKALQLNNSSGDRVGSYDVQYRMTGSLLGLLKLREGLAEVAFVLQNSNGEQTFDDLQLIPLGFWGVYIAVQEDNPLTEIKDEDLTEILRKTRDGLKSEWGTLMPNQPKWTNRLIFVTFDIEESDPSFPILLNQFFNNEVPEKYDSMGERIEDPYLASSANLLIMSKLPDSTRGLRSLAWIGGEENVGYPPSRQSLFYDDYPLRTPLYLAVGKKQDPKVRAFLEEFFSSSSLEMLEKSGLVPVPENVLKQALLEFDLEI